MAPDRIVGMDQIIADAQRLKFIAEPLKPEQLKEFVQIAEPAGAKRTNCDEIAVPRRGLNKPAHDAGKPR